MKKIILYLICLLFCINYITVPAYASVKPSFQIDSLSGYAGEKVTVQLILSNPYKISAIQFALKYDDSKLNITEDNFLYGDTIDRNWSKQKNIKDGSIYMAAFTNSMITVNESVIIATLSFTIKDSAQVGATNISIADFKAYYDDSTSVDTEITEGVITIKNKPSQTNNTNPVGNQSANSTENKDLNPLVDSDIESTLVTTDEAEKLIQNLNREQSTGNKKTEKQVIEIKAKEKLGNSIKTKMIMQKAAIDSIAKVEDLNVRLDMSLAQIEFDNKALDTIAKKSTEEVAFSVEKLDIENIIKDLPSQEQEKVRREIEDRPIYDFGVMSGTDEISHFNGGKATIILPYTLKPEEKPNNVVVYYLDSNGKLKEVNGRYDVNTKAVIIKLTHFSTYVIGYKEIAFADVSEHVWCYNSVSFVSARGLSSGVGGNLYAPNVVVTRGQFITMLCNAYGIEPRTNGENFSDAGDTWYTPYLAAAKQLNISSGVGDNKFDPDSKITREEMFALLYNALKVLGERPEDNANGKGIEEIKDSKSIASWAIEALAYLTENGIVMGTDGYINPKNTATRAEMAQLFYMLLTK